MSCSKCFKSYLALFCHKSSQGIIIDLEKQNIIQRDKNKSYSIPECYGKGVIVKVLVSSKLWFLFTQKCTFDLALTLTSE